MQKRINISSKTKMTTRGRGTRGLFYAFAAQPKQQNLPWHVEPEQFAKACSRGNSSLLLLDG